MPHISIAIPVFNRSHYLSQTLDCILNQDHTDIDVCVLDDASTDDSVEIIQKYCKLDSRVRLVENKSTLGLVKNWNQCLDVAIGPLVQLLLSDDLVDPNYLLVTSRIFDANPNIGFVAASCRYIDSNGTIIHPGVSQPAKLYKAGDEAVSFLLTRSFPHVSSIIYQKKCFDHLGKFDERLKYGPDIEMETRIASKFDFYHVGSVYTSFRRHGSNTGNLNYLRSDFLNIDSLTRRIAWNYLTKEGLARLGIRDLGNYLRKEEAVVALGGAVICISYGRPKFSVYYLRQAIKLNPNIILLAKFWKLLALLIFPNLGERIMRRRLQITQDDRSIVQQFERTL
jgi:glycosyltransferase involved in cell wall biosynthesis